MEKRIRKRIEFKGGCKTSVDAGQLPFGAFSMVQNMRNVHPGFKKRKGQIKLHTTADSTNRVMSLYQFSKGKVSENHFYAQMSDSDVLEATTAPPGVTAGAFGGEVFSGTASPYPASWSNVDDMMLFSNGVDQHQIYTGTGRKIDKFIVFKGAATPTTVPERGEDYSDNVRGFKSGNAILDSLGDLSADYDCIFVGCPVPFDTLTWTIPKPNGTAATMLCKYRKSDSTWAAVSGFTDNTSASSKTLATTGATMTWTMPTDWIENYMFGYNGFWVQLYLDTDGDLDSETEVSAVTFESDWLGIQNVWDGILVEAIEAQVLFAGEYYTYGSTAVDISALTSSDSIYISSYDPCVMIYVDVGSTPNTNAVTLTFNYWDGAAWQTLSATDNSSGFTQSGWVTFARSSLSFPQNFNGTQYYAHWFQITLSATLSTDTASSVAFYFAPYYNIDETGKGLANCSWKGRTVYSTNTDQYLYVTPSVSPQVLNGADYGMLEPGDGRPNLPVAMRRFKNELMVWQEEKGTDGGCLTLFEGYSVETFGKLVISSKLGTMSNNSVDIVEGVLTSTATEEVIKDLAYCLSRYGVYVTDGVHCSMISDDISNYFDPTDTTNCIRKGYEKLMWLKHDSSCNAVRLGLVCGSSATVPNVFPVYDITTKSWSFDSLGQELSCMTEVEAGSGNLPVLQVGGGVDDGYVYLLNNTADDVSTAIDSYATIELSDGGFKFNLTEIMFRCKVQSAGNVTITPYKQAVAQTAITKAMTAEVTNETTRRHRFNMNLTGHQLSLKFQNSTAAQSMNLYDSGIEMEVYEKQ